MEIIKLKDDYIKLGQALKAAGLVESGVEAKYAVLDGLVKVNGRTQLQRGKNSMRETLWNFRVIRSRLQFNMQEQRFCL